MPLIIYRRGEIWHYRGTVAGRLLRGTTGTKDKAAAARIANEIEGRHWKGRLDGPGAVLTFAQAALLYRRAGRSDRHLKPVEDYWKDTPVKDINAASVRASCFVLEPTAGPATRNRHVIVPTQAVINHAAEAELCPHLRVKRFPVVKTEKTPATWEWIQAFMRAAIAPPAHNPRVAALAAFMFLTGARVGEAVALRWSDIDFKTKRVLIRQTKVGKDWRNHMPPELIAALAYIPGERRDRVFGYGHPHNAKSQWAGAIRRAGIAKLSFHSCRHGFATTLLHAGVDPVTVAKLGGWKSPAHVFATYGHAMQDDTVVERLTGTPETQSSQKTSNIKAV
jgi:integrase